MSVLTEDVAKLQGAIASLAHKAKGAELMANDNKKKEQIIQQLNQKLSQHVKDKDTAQKIIENMNERLNKMTDRAMQAEARLKEMRAAYSLPAEQTEEAVNP